METVDPEVVIRSIMRDQIHSRDLKTTASSHMVGIMAIITITMHQHRQQAGSRLHLESRVLQMAHLHLTQAHMVPSPTVIPVNRNRNPDRLPTVVNLSLRYPSSDMMQRMTIEIMAMDVRIMDLLLVMVAMKEPSLKNYRST
jgi:hypothetical protein